MSQKSIKIVIFTTAFRPMIGGSEIAIEEITRRLKDIQFDIITPRYRSEYPAFESYGNISVYRVGFGSAIDKLIFPVAGFIKASALHGKNDYSKVHSYQASYGAMVGHMFKFFHKGVKSIVTLQEGKDLDHQPAILRLVRGHLIATADIITAISKYLSDYARRYAKNAPIYVIPNGVSTERFKKRDGFDGEKLKRELNIKPGEKVVVSVSRLVKKNGLSDLVKAIKDLKSLNSGLALKCLLIGDGPLKKSLELQVADFDLKDVFIFAGAVDNDKLPEYLWISDVFARPSLSEGLGTSFLEAMASELPVIGTDVGGIPDIIKDRETGMLVKPGDHESLARKINTILNDEQLRSSLVSAGLKMVEEKYDWDKIAGQFLNIYA